MIIATVALLSACGDDDVNDAVPRIGPFVGFTTGSELTSVVEGNTAFFEVVIFSDVSNTQDVTVNWQASGGDTRSGSITIPANSKSAKFDLPFAENTTTADSTDVTVTLTSNTIPLATDKGTRSAITFKLVDDKKIFLIGNENMGKIDTITVSESDGKISVPFMVLEEETIDEDIAVEIAVDGASTAVSDIDYKLENTFTLSKTEPAVVIDLVNNTSKQEDRFLKIDLVSLTGSDEVSVIDTVENSFVLKIVDDTKVFKLDRIDPAVPVGNDTLEITAAGTFSLDVLAEGGSLTGGVTLGMSADMTEPWLQYPFGDEITFAFGESTKSFPFTITSDAFDGLTDSIYIKLSISSITSVNGDEEVVLAEGVAGANPPTSLVIEIKAP